MSRRGRGRRPGRAGRTATRGVLLAALVLAGALFLPRAQAREGFYFALGPARQSVGGDLSGNTVIANFDGSNEARLGELEAGGGFAFGGGYGFTANVALDLLMTNTLHDAAFGPPGAQTPQEADLTAVLFGARLVLPAADDLELFGRIGLGGYELIYEGANFSTASGLPVDKVRLNGRGFGAGVGAEFLLGNLGFELALTRHALEFDTIDSLNFQPEFSPALAFDITAVTALLTFNFR